MFLTYTILNAGLLHLRELGNKLSVEHLNLMAG